MRWVKAFVALLRETVAEWIEDKAPRLGAALAYYSVFSLAPLLIVAIVISGAFFGQSAAQERIVAEIASLIGTPGAVAVNRMIENAKLPSNAGAPTIVIGVVTLLVGALGVFGQLQDAFDTIWEVTPDPRANVIRLLRTRLMSFAMVLVVAFLLLVLLIIHTLLASVASALEARLPNFSLLATALNLVLPLVVATLLFALMFKVLPDVDIAWRDVLPGALLTAALFVVGKAVIGFYLGTSRLGTASGAAGSVLIILVWVYYTAQILFFGAEFTQVYVRRYGHRRPTPTAEAVPVTEAARLHQGMPHLAAPARPARPPWVTHPRWPHAQRPPARNFTGTLLGFVAGLGAGILVALRAVRGSG
jgi:membrane protein